MQVIFRGYRLDFAVKIRSIMLYTRWQGNEQSRQAVWTPTQNFLEDFAGSRPWRVTLFLGRVFIFAAEPGSACQNIYIANHRNEVAYLCTMFNDSAFLHFARTAEGTPFQAVTKRVVRNPVYYIVASQTDALSRATATDCVTRYLQSYTGTPIANLAMCRLKLSSKELGEKIDDIVLGEAKNLSHG